MRAAVVSIERKSRGMTLCAISAMAPASSTPVGPAPIIANGVDFAVVVADAERERIADTPNLVEFALRRVARRGRQARLVGLQARCIGAEGDAQFTVIRQRPHGPGRIGPVIPQ